MDDKPIEIPGSRWEWLLADKRRLAALVAGLLVALGLAAALAVPALFGDGSEQAAEPDGIDSVPPTNSVDATGAPDAGTEPTPTVDGADGSPDADAGTGGTPGTGAGDAAPRPVAPGRAPYLAYRMDGQVWVSREDGSRPVAVAESARGTFALAPDGTALALVDEGELSLITVGDLSRVEVGQAEPHALAWEADSSSVLFLRAGADDHGATEVWRAPRRVGARPVRLVQAGAPSVASDGTVVALPVPVVAVDPTAGSVWVLPGGRSPREVATRGHPVACDVEAGTIAYAVSGLEYTDESGEQRQVDPEVRVMRTDGSAARRIVGRPRTDRPFGYSNLMLSPDGQLLLYAEVGDDGYSRAWIVPVAGGAPVSLTTRRDTYPLGWSADGASVFFIEGNAFQGEPTVLMAAGANGFGRRTVVEGAGL